MTEKYNQEFQEYTDIDPEFKEQNKMSRNDTGIDACNLIDTIVQCKLRQHYLGWKECSTFFGSNLYRDNNKKINIMKNIFRHWIRNTFFFIQNLYFLFFIFLKKMISFFRVSLNFLIYESFLIRDH